MARDVLQEDMELAAEDVLEEEEDEEDEGEKPIYNPLNLPMGWDGKPIPYWLYRLHGLSKSVRQWRALGAVVSAPRAATDASSGGRGGGGRGAAPVQPARCSTTAKSATKSSAGARSSSGTSRNGSTQACCAKWAFPTRCISRT